jgi:hypothetical protein
LGEGRRRRYTRAHIASHLTPPWNTCLSEYTVCVGHRVQV